MLEIQTSSVNYGKSIVLIGLMGSGKTTIGRKLSYKLNLPFLDSDEEVVKVSGCSIPDIFRVYGEEAFRDTEKKIMLRCLNEKPTIIATGGGAFLNKEIRKKISERGISVWLRASLETLEKRTANKTGRPLLNDNEPRRKLSEFIALRYPIYAEADIIIDTGKESTTETVNSVYNALRTK